MLQKCYKAKNNTREISNKYNKNIKYIKNIYSQATHTKLSFCKKNQNAISVFRFFLLICKQRIIKNFIKQNWEDFKEVKKEANASLFFIYETNPLISAN